MDIAPRGLARAQVTKTDAAFSSCDHARAVRTCLAHESDVRCAYRPRQIPGVLDSPRSEEALIMPITKELTIRMENRPGLLGTICGALAERGVNILALQSIPSQRTTLVCVVADDPKTDAATL